MNHRREHPLCPLQEFGQTSGDSDVSVAEYRNPIFREAFQQIAKSAEEGGTLKGVMFWNWDVSGAASRGDDEYLVKESDSTFWQIITPYSEAVSKAMNARPLASNCFPMSDGAPPFI